MTLRPLVHDRRSPARRTAIRWIKRGLLALGALAIVALLVRAWLPKPVVVDVATAHRGELVTEVDEDGKTRVHDRFVVAAPIAGNLERIELEAGAPVRKGDVIARIAPPDSTLLDPR
ncbi:MAG: biotin/lipoyl-binding protein, partial [Acidobacteriota bacterium]